MTARESDRLRNLYALYASKNRLCTLCENTTPKKTAYNAYRNKNRRVRRAEGTKMYALKDAYRLHTKCIQTHKRRRNGEIPLLLLLYCSCFLIFYCSRFMGDHLLLFASSGMYGYHWTVQNHLIARLSRSGSPPCSAVMADCRHMQPVCVVCIKKLPMHSMWEHNSEKDCIQCIQKRE